MTTPAVDLSDAALNELEHDLRAWIINNARRDGTTRNRMIDAADTIAALRERVRGLEQGVDSLSGKLGRFDWEARRNRECNVQRIRAERAEARVAELSRTVASEEVERVASQLNNWLIDDTGDPLSLERSAIKEEAAFLLRRLDRDLARVTSERDAAVKDAAARDVLAERLRQISVECFNAPHDDEHWSEELAFAAACYATADEGDEPPAVWPWESQWWKPKDRRRNLVRAGALILAEIERLDRAASMEGKG